MFENKIWKLGNVIRQDINLTFEHYYWFQMWKYCRTLFQLNTDITIISSLCILAKKSRYGEVS